MDLGLEFASVVGVCLGDCDFDGVWGFPGSFVPPDVPPVTPEPELFESPEFETLTGVFFVVSSFVLEGALIRPTTKPKTKRASTKIERCSRLKFTFVFSSLIKRSAAIELGS